MKMPRIKLLTSSLLILAIASVLIFNVSAQEADVTSAASISVLLADNHSDFGCASCHVDGEESEVENSSCLECHGPQEVLKEKTLQMQINPHDAPHFGMDSCTMCHHGHSEFENICLTCHLE